MNVLARPRPGLLGVDLAAAFNLVGALLKYLSLAALFPAAIALGYGEPVWPFLASAAIAAAAGQGLELGTRGREHVGVREGFLVVSLTWLLAAAFGALPYLLSGEEQLSRPVDALFEAMSGFTTTGATIVRDVDDVSHSVAMWRQFSQWLGGMGILVLALAILPRLRVGGRQLLEHELPGPEIEPLAASIRDTARRLWLLYIILTALEVLVLSGLAWTQLDSGMGLYDAVAHAFTTMPLGGFSTEPRSLEAFSPVTQLVVVGFIVVAGANFALLYRAIVRRRPAALGRDEEFRLYLGLLALGSVVLTIELWSEGVYDGAEALRHAVFQATSIMTGTGYASADFADWTVLAGIVLVALMFFGASAGSATGSVKIVRHLVIGKIVRRELRQTVHPELVLPVRFNGTIVDDRSLRAVLAFVVLYVGIFALGTLALLIDAARVDSGLTPFEALAAAASTLGNVGPAFGFAGPMGSYEPFTDVSKGIMILLMYVGRLEIVPVAVLLTRSYWRV